MPTTNLLILDNLACERGETRLFEDCSAVFSAGEWWQIAGHNGIGKTSLLRILAGLSVPVEGEVRWHNMPIRSSRSEYHAQLFYLGHHAGIKPELSAWENLRFYQKMHRLPLSDEALWFALGKVGLMGREDLPCSHLSAGQQRRVALAQLWLTQARLWILDEPFTALDSQGVSDLVAQMRTHCAAGGLVVFTSHQAINDPAILQLDLADFKVSL